VFQTDSLIEKFGPSPRAKRGLRQADETALPSNSPDIERRSDYVTSAEALKLLGVKQQTLYAYVSRGMIRSLPHFNGRSRYYMRNDVERVRERGSMRYGPDFVASGAMRGSQAVIDTSITEITARGPAYRGRLAVDLARAGTPFENVAEFLWGGELLESPVHWKESCPSEISPLLAMADSLHNGRTHIVQLMCMAVLGLGIATGTRGKRLEAGRSPLDIARQIICTQAGVMGFYGADGHITPMSGDCSIASMLVQVFKLGPSPEYRRAIDGMLVVLADHELHPATFAARVAASTSSDMHSCVCAALNTHYGTLVGRACDRVEALFEPSASLNDVLEVVRGELKVAKGLPGFDHPFYPSGDPRALFLTEQALRIAKSDNAAVRMMYRLKGLIEEDFGVSPSIEFGLVMLCRALGLPSGSASGLYALGFTSGWVAHIIEQRKAGFIIRPRAKYLGSVAKGGESVQCGGVKSRKK